VQKDLGGVPYFYFLYVIVLCSSDHFFYQLSRIECSGAKELHELFGSTRGKSFHGVGDDVRMDVILEIKANSDAARAGTL
jgi:hypothetical protein